MINEIKELKEIYEKSKYKETDFNEEDCEE